jgi:hypothetical protein
LIRLVESLRYRCLRDIRQELDSFQVLVGPNASGKSTFLDVIRLPGDLLRRGVVSAIRDRSSNPRNLFWMGEGQRFEVALELQIPEERRRRLPHEGYKFARYEVAVGLDSRGELSLLGETLWLKPAEQNHSLGRTRDLFPNPRAPRDTIMLAEGKHAPKGWKKVITKKPETGNDYFISETTGWNNPFRLGPQRLALANLPEDEERFPVATWVKRFLIEGVHNLVLNSEAMRQPSPPGSPIEFQPDGSNLPWVIQALRDHQPDSFERWVAHVRTALPDIKTIETVQREEDKHRYIRIVYTTGLKAPSWTVSDGTLRLLALTRLWPILSIRGS